jgi:hypothetical protein
LFNANGDSISMTDFGTFTPMTIQVGSITETYGSITETYRITGGTGRFAGAQGGSFIVQRLANLVGPTFTGGVLLQGTITLSGAENP